MRTKTNLVILIDNFLNTWEKISKRKTSFTNSYAVGINENHNKELGITSCQVT